MVQPALRAQEDLLQHIIGIDLGPEPIRDEAADPRLKTGQVAIGSCTNSSYTDLMMVAQVFKGRRIDPLVELGISPGSREVLNMLAANGALADVIADAVGAGTDPGAASVLEAYAEWRAADQRRVAAMTDSLARLFTNPLAPVGAARRLGLLGLDLVPAPKKALARQAMGIRGRLPRLAGGIPLS